MRDFEFPNTPSTEHGLLWQMLGCRWGRGVSTPDDSAPCERQAKRVIVVHDGPAEVELKLCDAHAERLEQETTPH